MDQPSVSRQENHRSSARFSSAAMDTGGSKFPPYLNNRHIALRNLGEG
jgi:hypothetical protein